MTLCNSTHTPHNTEKTIVTMGNPILHRVAQEMLPHEFSSHETQKLIDDLKVAMAPTHASGIAAPQIGVNKRLVIFGYDKLKNYPSEPPVPFTVLINPTYRAIDPEDMIEVWEHCLSIPGMRGKTIRYHKITYSGYQPDGSLVTREATGIHAVLVQHEIDHLDGILFNTKVQESKCFGFIREFESCGTPLGMKRIKPDEATK